MSAILSIKATALNIHSEEGFNAREFSTEPNVIIRNDYQSLLFLIYCNNKCRIQNRWERYRNHFTLYRNADSLILVRSETTLKLTDHDAVLQYDVIKPKIARRSPCVEDRWSVSYDDIYYSNKCPKTFFSFTLFASGEWWYFDKGICLLGTSAYRQNRQTNYYFMYLEFYNKNNSMYNLQSNQQHLNLPTSDALNINNTSSEVPLTSTSTASTVNTTSNSTNITNLNNTATITTSSNITKPTTINSTNNPTTSSSRSSNNTTTTEIQGSNPETCNDSNLQNVKLTNANNISIPINFTSSRLPLPTEIMNTPSAHRYVLPSTVSSIPSTRYHIHTNDIVQKQETRIHKIVPSLYWFTTRDKELINGDISYFLPTNNYMNEIVAKKLSKSNNFVILN